MEISPSQISIIGFIEENEIVNEKGERISFYDRPFLYDPMRDWSRFQCYKKGAQGIGMSVTMALKTFYSAKYMGWGFIHNFPTDADAGGFVKTKVNKLLKANKCFGGIDSDSIELKMFNNRPIHYQGSGSASGAVSKTVDVVIEDEKDRSNQMFLKDLESRTINSDFKGKWSLSNPSADGVGIDEDWENSDKKEWFITCHNGHSHPMTWPNSLDLVKKIFICSECKTELSDEDRRHGEWIQTGKPDAKFSGYHMTLLFAPRISAEYILEQWNDGADEEYFYNFILGEPYSPGDTKIERHVILDNWTPRNIETGEYFLGVDVGNIKHYVLGSSEGVLQVGTFTAWSDLDVILNKHRPISVMDAMPENTMAHHYKDTFPSFFICHFSRDKENNSIVRWGEKDKTGIVFVDRSRAIDRLVSDLLDGKILFSLPSDRLFRTFLDHCGTLRREKKMNALGVERYVWRTLGEDEGSKKDDHFLFALLYYYVARESKMSGAASVIGLGPEVQSIKQTKHGFINNLEEDLESRIYG